MRPLSRIHAIPSVPELLRRAEEIGVIARERAVEHEKARQISADLVDKMRAAELFRIMQPRRFGGFEYGYDVFVEAVSAVASGDGSTGWVYSLGAVHPWMIACYPEEAQHDFWETGARRRSPRSPMHRPARPRTRRAAIACPDAGASPAAATMRNGASSAASFRSRTGRSPASSWCRVPISRFSTTGTRWVSPPPAARRSWYRTHSFRPIAPSPSPTC